MLRSLECYTRQAELLAAMDTISHAMHHVHNTQSPSTRYATRKILRKAQSAIALEYNALAAVNAILASNAPTGAATRREYPSKQFASTSTQYAKHRTVVLQ